MTRTIITIGRQYGSGGKEIGLKAAEKLGIQCYDSRLIQMAAQEANMMLKGSLMWMKKEQIPSCFLYPMKIWQPGAATYFP